MAYNIYKSDGTPVVIPDNVIDQTFYNPTANGAGRGLGTQLLGRNVIDYGAPVAQTFLQLTENFNGTVMPSDTTALQGQLWFNKASSADGQLYVRFTANVSGGLANWRKVVTTSSSETGTTPIINPSSTPKAGDIRVSGTGLTFKIEIYGDGSWKQVFPAVYS